MDLNVANVLAHLISSGCLLQLLVAKSGLPIVLCEPLEFLTDSVVCIHRAYLHLCFYQMPSSKETCSAFRLCFFFFFLSTFYSGAIESVLTQCISVWYGNSLNQDCKADSRALS